MLKKKLIIFSRDIEFLKNIYSNLGDKVKNKIIINKIFTKEKNNSIENKKFFKCKNINNYLNEFNINKIVLDKKYYINEKILYKFYNVEKKFNFMLDFYESDKFPYKNVEKRSLYYYFLNKLINFFKSNKMDYIFFSHNPHDLIDVMILEMAKIFKIKCFYVRGFPLINHFKIDNNFKKIRNKNRYKKEISLTTLKKNAKNFYVLKKENKKIQNFFLIKSKIVNYNYFNLLFLIYYNCSFLIYFFNILKSLIKIFILNHSIFFDNYLKFKDKKKITKFNFEEIIFRNNIKKFQLLEYYSKISKKINYNQKYVFCPLWFQPSSTSYPFCGDFINYEIIINMLDETIPKNYKIIIKESPDIFNLNRNAWFRGPFVRKESFYKNLRKKNRIIFANIYEPDYKLIKNSKFVCGLPDLSLFSSYINKKKIIVFGEPLFPKTHGINFCFNTDSLRRAIFNHLNSRNITSNDLSKFTSELNNDTFHHHMIDVNKINKTNYKKISRIFENQLN